VIESKFDSTQAPRALVKRVFTAGSGNADASVVGSGFEHL
jgi:hypothetical protein